MSRILCWFGLHAWAYEYGREHQIMQERRCYRCPKREAPYNVPRTVVGASNFERAA